MESFEKRMQGAGGIQLFYRALVPDNPRAAIALIHGLAEHSGRYAHVIKFLADKGYACYALDLRGLGRSEGVRGHADRFEDMIGDVVNFARLVKETLPNKPLFLVGHSMGGLLVLSAGIHQPEVCDGIVASSPVLGIKAQVPGWKKGLARIIGSIAPRLAMDNGIPCEDISRDPAVVGAYRIDPLLCTKVTARFYLELTRGIQEAVEGAAQMRLPFLILQAGADKLVDPEASRSFVDRAPASDKRFVLFEGQYHELFNEPEKQQTLECVGHWLESHVTGGE